MKPAGTRRQRARLALPLLALSVAGGATPVWAAGQVYGLTDQQKAEVANAPRAASAGAATVQLPDGAPDRQVHGEVAAMVGTGGARGIAGSAAIPLGQNGGAVLSFESSRFGDRRHGWR